MKKKKALILGTGSISKKHEKALLKIGYDVFFYTKRSIVKKNIIKSKKDFINLNPDIFVVASKTSDHFKQLSFIEKNFKNKTILIEKPLFHKYFKKTKVVNKVFVGYNLRFHPIIKFLKKKLKTSFFFIDVSCQSFLPEWRSNINYQNSYSANQRFGGGVLLDLSHEIDFIEYIFGKINKVYFSFNKKISNLNINSKDIFLMNGKVGKINFRLNLNYFSRYRSRLILLYGKKETFKCDLIKNKIEIFKNNKKKEIILFKPTNSFDEMYKEIFDKNKNKTLSTYSNALNLMRLINKL